MKVSYFLILFLFVTNLYGQDFSERVIPVEDESGFLLRESPLFMDSNNFLWLVSSRGLIKIVGEQRIFYPFNNLDVSMMNTHSVRLKEISSDLLIGSSNVGIFKVNLLLGEIEWMDFPINFSRVLSGRSLVMDSNSNIYLATNDGLVIRCNIDDGSVNFFEVLELLIKINPISEYLEVEFSVEKGLIIKDNVNHYLYDFVNIETVDKLKLSSDLFQYLSKNGAVFPKGMSGTYDINGTQFSYTFNPKSNTHTYQLPKNRAVTFSRTDEIVILNRTMKYETGVDLIKINLKKDSTSIKKVKSKNTFWGMSLSTGGDIFVTHEKGLSIYKEVVAPVFNSIDFKKNKIYSSRSIVKLENGDFHIATYRGNMVLKKGQDSLQSIQFKNENGKVLPNLLYGLLKYDDNTLIAYGDVKGIYIVNVQKKSFIAVGIPTKGTARRYFQIRDIEKLDSDNIVIAGTFGLMVYDLKKNKFRNVDMSESKAFKKNAAISDIYFDPISQDLWMGMSNSETVIRKNLATKQMVEYTPTDVSLKNIGGITMIHPDEYTDDIWVGSTLGLLKIANNTLVREKTLFGQDASNSIVSIQQTDDLLWLATYSGLIKFDKETKRKAYFYESDGLSNNEFNKKSFLKVSDDSLFFGGVKGISLFNPAKLAAENRSKNTVFLSEASYFSKSKNQSVIQISRLDQATSFSYPSAQNQIALKFGVNEPFQQTDKLYYKIDELDKKELLTIDVLSIQGLSPGKHLLEVKGEDKNGVLLNTLRYDLFVTQPIYKKTWFTTVLFLLIIFFLILSYRARRVELRQEVKFQLDRSTLLRSQMSPHLVFNALNGIQSAMLLEGEVAVNNYIVTYSKFIRCTLQMNTSEYVSLQDKLKYLEAYLQLEKIKLNNNFEYVIDVEGGLELKKILVPCLFIQPMIENAIIHGLLPKEKNRKLEIRMYSKNDSLLVEIIDNGLGRALSKERNSKKEMPSKSYGMDILRKRIKYLNSVNKGKITFEIVDLVEGEIALGTKILFHFPMN